MTPFSLPLLALQKSVWKQWCAASAALISDGTRDMVCISFHRQPMASKCKISLELLQEKSENYRTLVKV